MNWNSVVSQEFDELAVAETWHADFMATGRRTRGLLADLDKFDHVAAFGLHFPLNSLQPWAGPNLLTSYCIISFMVLNNSSY